MTTATELSPTVRQGGVTIEQLPDDYEEPVVTKTTDQPSGNLLSRIWNAVCEWFRLKTREFEMVYYQNEWNEFNEFWERHWQPVLENMEETIRDFKTRRRQQLEEINELKFQLSHLNKLD